MRRGFSEALLSAATLAVLLLVLVAADDRVRDQFTLRMSRPSVEVADASHRVRDLTTVIVGAVRDQSIEHAPMVIFALAAGVLTLFMLRT